MIDKDSLIFHIKHWRGTLLTQLTYTHINRPYLYLEGTKSTYFGIKKECLDMHTMKYRVFGAVWILKDGKKYILGYWFADKVSEILIAIKDAGFSSPIQSQKNDVDEIYQTIRMEQDRDNWTQKSRLPFICILKKPWKDLRKGWYILKSSTNYPTILTCIQKKQYSIWIEHIQVCEHKNDAVKFINLINTEHNIQLSSVDFVEFGKNNIKRIDKE